MIIMTENKQFEALANLVLQSISVWEDMHMYAISYSAEYNAFWGLLDEDLKSAVYTCRRQNREERLVPFTMTCITYYKGLLKPESFDRIRGQYWKKQLKTILNDSSFRSVMANLVCTIKSEYKYCEHHTAVNKSTQLAHTRVG